MPLLNIPALKDNYIWILVLTQRRAIIIDPGDALPVLACLQAYRLTPVATLLTHHHADHTEGVSTLKAIYPLLPIYGPAETLSTGVTHLIHGESTLTVCDTTVQIMSVPGHTLGHVAYYLPQGALNHPALFCGDTLFSAGCGRLFEGSAQQLFQSLQRLIALPANTQLCCAHEYTLENLRFARFVDESNPFLLPYQQKITYLRRQGKPSLPTSLHTQRLINPFLRCHHPALQQRLGLIKISLPPGDVFAELRRWKDHF
jgi:hydroxyacylglutathione hydrolase